jgi:ankyrin repeat protein
LHGDIESRRLSYLLRSAGWDRPSFDSSGLLVAEVLLAHGADVNARDIKFGDTPLFWAVFAGQKDMAELLLAHGADVNARDNSGNTPLYEALKRGKTDVANLLRQHGGRL